MWLCPDQLHGFLHNQGRHSKLGAFAIYWGIQSSAMHYAEYSTQAKGLVKDTANIKDMQEFVEIWSVAIWQDPWLRRVPSSNQM